MEKYTIGIYFNETLEKVALILKNRPTWQADKYNFPGGHIELGETGTHCIRREFEEECCINSKPIEWSHIGNIINYQNYVVEIHTCVRRKEHGELITGEDQSVNWFDIEDGLPNNMISNLNWLIPFAVNTWFPGNADDLKFGNFEYEYSVNAKRINN